MEPFRILAWLVAVGCALAATLGVLGVFFDPLDNFNHFAPLTLTAALVAVSVQSTSSRGRATSTLILALLAATISAAVMAPEFIAKAVQAHARPGGHTIKIVELNLWSNNVDLPGTARWLAAQTADVVVLEEVVTNAWAAPDLLKHAYPYRSACEPGIFCTTVILSRARPSASGAFPSPDGYGLHSAAWATFGQGGDAFTVVGDHAPWPQPRQHQQAQTALLAARLTAFDRRSLIVAGDFNSTPWSFSLRRQDELFGLERRTRALLTFPVQPYTKWRLWTPVPLLAIDHIYAGSAWKTVSVTRGPRLGSDHLPTVAVLRR